MYTRRKLNQSLALLAASALGTTPGLSWSKNSNQDDWFMPDEGEPHQRTWMAFGASKDVWGGKLLPEVQRNLATIARTIAQFEPVAMLVRREDEATARALVGSSKDVELVVCPLDDLWVRDSGPVFVVTEDGRKAGVDFNFNGWGSQIAQATIRRFLRAHLNH